MALGPKLTSQKAAVGGAQDRFDEVQRTSAVIKKAFAASGQPDPAKANWINQFEAILTQSTTEQAAYDFKQGFLRLDEKAKFDEDNFTKILQTIVGIANIGEGSRGYVIVGVADNPAAADRIEKLYGSKARPYREFLVTGIAHEADKLGETLDAFYRRISLKIKDRMKILSEIQS